LQLAAGSMQARVDGTLAYLQELLLRLQCEIERTQEAVHAMRDLGAEDQSTRSDRIDVKRIMVPRQLSKLPELLKETLSFE